MPPAPARLARSIATVTLSGSLPDKLEAAARAGFDAVEIFDADLMTFDGSPADIRRIAGDLGLGIALWQPFRDFEAVDPARLARNLDRAERKFDVMEALGAPLMLVCSSTDPAALPDDARAAADLAALAARAAARGLALGYEALAWGRHVNRWRHAWRIVAQAAHPALGLVLDSFHVLAVGDDLAGLDQVPADRLVLRPARRRAAAVARSAVLEPPSPGLPRPGPVAGGGLSRRRARRRLHRPAVARNLQRRNARRPGPADGARRAARARAAGGRGAAHDPRRRAARARQLRRDRVPGIRGRSRLPRRTRALSAARSASPVPGGTGPNRWSCTARAAPT